MAPFITGVHKFSLKTPTVRWTWALSSSHGKATSTASRRIGLNCSLEQNPCRLCWI